MGNSKSKARSLEDVSTAAVFVAVRCDSLADLQALVLSQGIGSMYARNLNRATPLFCATSVAVAAFLVENGADVNARNNYNEMPLRYMALLRDDLLTATEFLLQNGADTNAAGVRENGAAPSDERESSETSRQAWREFRRGVHAAPTIYLQHNDSREADRAWRVSQRLLKVNGHASALGSDGGSVDLGRFMIDHGVPVDSTSTIQGTALYVAASRGHLGIVKYLLEKNASVHGDELFEKVPLRGAMTQGRIDVMVELVAYGASFNPKTSADESQVDSSQLLSDASLVVILNLMIENLSEIKPPTTTLVVWLAKMTELRRAIPDIEGLCERLVQRLDMALNLIKSGKILPSDANTTKFALVALRIWKWMLEYEEKTVAGRILASVSYYKEIGAHHKAIGRFQGSSDPRDEDTYRYRDWETDQLLN